MLDPRLPIRILRAVRSRMARSIGEVRAASGCYDVVVVSPGGVGTTELIRSLRQIIRCNEADDRDGLKHIPDPDLLPAKQRIIFVFDSPEKIVLSLRARKLLIPQRFKLQVSVLGSSEYFLSLNELVVAQIGRFQDRRRTLLIHYDNLFESKDQIADFLDLPSQVVAAALPQRKPRTSVGKGKGL